MGDQPDIYIQTRQSTHALKYYSHSHLQAHKIVLAGSFVEFGGLNDASGAAARFGSPTTFWVAHHIFSWVAHQLLFWHQTRQSPSYHAEDTAAMSHIFANYWRVSKIDEHGKAECLVVGPRTWPYEAAPTQRRERLSAQRLRDKG